MLAFMKRLLLSCDSTAFNELHHARGHHLRMDAKILLSLQRRCHGVGDTADAQLQRITIMDEVCNVRPNFQVLLIGYCVWK